ncbi:MAG: hypothetical protein D3910_20965 [Candidatus Electrothrix sp. ATG2]|nr:hypothetical protein [Candidatus Electrothrix sp. ATG2]
MTGEWSKYSCKISKEASKAFKEAFKGFTGYQYTPVAVAQQVVSGVKYSFFCNAEGVFPHSVPEGAIITIYKPQKRKAKIQHIQIIHQ